MPNPTNYQGIIPLQLYLILQNVFPQNYQESDVNWLKRMTVDPRFVEMLKRVHFHGKLKTEMTQAVHRRWMAQAGAQRVGTKKAGPALINVKRKPGSRVPPTSTIAQRYREELMVPNQNEYKHATEAYDLLIEQSEVTTPVDGCIFWNGINELALAKLVDQWNENLNGEIYGQLEATTTARYVNKQFEWVTGGVFQQYFTEVSDKLGEEARGHVTSVVRCGLRDDSIFTVTELPRILKSMEDSIKSNLAPAVTDITIVVIEPRHLEERPVKAFTNNEISMIPIVRKLNPYINGRADCSIAGHLDMSLRLREYWTKRGQIQESSAAGKIKADFEQLIRWP